MLLSYALATGLTSGALYALIAVGLVMVYKATGVINIAHGELFMFCGFVAYAVHVQLGLSYLAAFAAAIVFGFALGALVYQAAFKSLMKSSLANVLIAAIAISFILKGIARSIWGGKGDYIPVSAAVLDRSAASWQCHDHAAAARGRWRAIVLMVALGVFFKTTRVGKWMQATADNAKAANWSACAPNGSYLLSFAVGAAVAGVAAVVMAPFTLLYPDVGFVLFLKGFAAAVLGGLTSIVGAVLGGFLVGLIESWRRRSCIPTSRRSRRSSSSCSP